jgi:uncharacterized protein (TIGR00288 family)
MNEQKAATERQIAVLIDFENVGLNSIQGLFDQISDTGRIIIKRAYADWGGANSNRDQLQKLGIDPVHLLRSTSGGKNSSDIKLVVDAIDLLYSSPVDTFVIVSSDSDFVPLINRLRAAGKTVFGAGEQEKATPSLVIACDRYFYLDKEKSFDSSPKTPVVNELEYLALVRRAVNASIDEHGSVHGSKLHSTIQKLDPGFDYKAAGFSTFTKFLIKHLENATEMKVVRPKSKGDVTVQLIDKPKLSIKLTTRTPNTNISA